MKRIFRTFWGLWAVIVFMSVMVIITPFYFIIFTIWGKNAHAAMITFSYQVAARTILWGLLIRCRVHGNKNFTALGGKKGFRSLEKPCVFVSNHQSDLDILANCVAGPVNFKFLGKKEANKIPLFGYIINNICILIDRKSKESKAAGMRAMEKSLSELMPVIIYPEGTRNRSDQPLKDFYDGAFRLAIEAQVPIMVQTLVGSGRLSNPNRIFDKSPGIIDCFWDGPVPTTGMTLTQTDELKETVRQIMLNRLKN